ncbi:hypothetical protein [Flavobacterium sp. 245]|uniref:hypothetical protein n=1 Tax=Flavobacterium sp. 245 TaxID=2512115 RepID=UPI00105F15F5|nr:hypothetical protein [Flavobacterium sp. 245]TDO97724.1 hypothetical protein EV145_10983 [Flavobacterium sp. 245]
MYRKIIVLAFFVFFSISAFAQKIAIKKIVADRTTKLPLDKVNVYNEKDNSLTNQEGAFSFISDVNEINFSLIGYNDLKLSFDEVQKLDTIFLKSSIVELDEVVVGSEMAIIKKAYSKLKENYGLEPYNENFFFRCTLKRNNELSRLQDIYGTVSRKSIFKTKSQPDNKCSVEILNMRKVGIADKKDFIYFKFQSFEELFNLNSLIQISLDNYELTQEKNVKGDYYKISFVKKEINEINQKTSGYFIINKQDYAIIETYFDFYDDPDNVPFTKDGKANYRTKLYKRTSNYKKSNNTNKYYLSNANSTVQVELAENEKVPKAIYDYTTNFFVTNSFISSKANSNLSIDKDIFKVKFPYEASFWASQNQLPLTSDLKDFLSRVSDNKDKKEEFEVIGNF